MAAPSRAGLNLPPSLVRPPVPDATDTAYWEARRAEFFSKFVATSDAKAAAAGHVDKDRPLSASPSARQHLPASAAAKEQALPLSWERGSRRGARPVVAYPTTNRLHSRCHTVAPLDRDDRQRPAARLDDWRDSLAKKRGDGEGRDRPSKASGSQSSIGAGRLINARVAFDTGYGDDRDAATQRQGGGR